MNRPTGITKTKFVLKTKIERQGQKFRDTLTKHKTPLASVHELSVHAHERFLGTVHVRVRFVPEKTSAVQYYMVSSLFQSLTPRGRPKKEGDDYSFSF